LTDGVNSGISANNLNTGKGKLFQARAAAILGAHLGVTFKQDYPLPIGNPSKVHKFDLVSDGESPRFVRFIDMRMDRREQRAETLTEYYYRTYRHLLKGVRLFEIDLETGDLREHE
jgi:hypothetical protein